MNIIEPIGLQREKVNKRTKFTHEYYKVECPYCKKTYTYSWKKLTAGSKQMCIDCDIYAHDGVNSNLYSRFTSMMSRCYKKSNKSYKYYGAVGVTVCDEWIDNPTQYMKDMLEMGFDPELRIDKDLKCREMNISPPIYRKDTITFLTVLENAQVKREIVSTNTSGFRGVSKEEPGYQYVSQINHDGKAIQIHRSRDKLECAIAYNDYIDKHKLLNTKNSIPSNILIAFRRMKEVNAYKNQLCDEVASLTSELISVNKRLDPLSIELSRVEEKLRYDKTILNEYIKSR